MPAAVEIRGLQEAIRGLESLAAEIEAEVEDTVDTSLGRMARALAVYPPAVSGSHYNRTEALRRGWTSTDRVFRVGPGGIDAVLRNPVSYAPFVQDEEEQAWMHVGRWQTVQGVQEREEAQIAMDIEAAVGRAITRVGL